MGLNCGSNQNEKLTSSAFLLTLFFLVTLISSNVGIEGTSHRGLSSELDDDKGKGKGKGDAKDPAPVAPSGGAPAAPGGGACAAGVINVMQQGAKGDGKTDDSTVFIKAWNLACKSTGPGKLLIPAGKFLVGPVLMEGPCTASPIVVENLGEVLANTDISLYAGPEWLLFEKVKDLQVVGTGTYNGQGAHAWPLNQCDKKGKSAGCTSLPTSLKFRHIDNLLVEGIHSVDSMFFHMFISNCNKVTVRNVNIVAPGDSPNTDGIHISGSNGVTITNSVIGTGDDCVSVGQGSLNVNITKVMCGPGHGISIGSLGKGQNEDNVANIFISNCTLKQTTNGARIKTWGGPVATTATKLVYDDIIMDNVENPILIDQFYGENKGESHVKISDVTFRNIRGTSADDMIVSLNCSAVVPCAPVVLDNINLKPLKGAPLTSCLNVKPTMIGVNVGISCGGAAPKGDAAPAAAGGKGKGDDDDGDDDKN